MTIRIWDESLVGTKVKVITGNFGFVKDGIYTLKTKYIENGVWIQFYIGDKDVGKDTNMWLTEEKDGIGIEEKYFEVLK